MSAANWNRHGEGRDKNGAPRRQMASQRDPMDPFGRALNDDEGPGGGTFARERQDAVPMGQDLDRSRQIFKEPHTRRNQPDRPKIERHYLDRLLRQF